VARPSATPEKGSIADAGADQEVTRKAAMRCKEHYMEFIIPLALGLRKSRTGISFKSN
jgi:hypothetical protein